MKVVSIVAAVFVIVVAGIVATGTAFAEMQTVCAGQVPRGWIKVGDRWDPTKCGNPVNIVYNVWTIEKYRGKPAGSIMNACADTPPRGWSIISERWDPTQCGRPAMSVNNVMTIKRLDGGRRH